jgi:hypothetical protein
MAALPSGGKMKNLFCILLLAVMLVLVIAQYAWFHFNAYARGAIMLLMLLHFLKQLFPM